jgi:hypothetical protein
VGFGREWSARYGMKGATKFGFFLQHIELLCVQVLNERVTITLKKRE